MKALLASLLALAVPAASAPPRVVIVGGGFGGLSAAKALSGKPVQVTLLDRRNFHLFQPLLYQAATAGLPPSDIARPLREMLRRSSNIDVVLGKAESIDLENRKVVLTDGELTYDRLILAAGARASYFGHPEWAAHAPSLKTVEDAVEIRRRLQAAFEKAELEPDPEARRRLLTFVVVGGGPTGVELAGSIAGLARSLKGEFRRIDPSASRVILIEGGPRLLPFIAPNLGEAARRSLVRRGVEVRTNTLVTDISERGVAVKTASFPAKTVIWASGVEASPLAKTLGVNLDRAGRIVVLPDLTVPLRPEVFAVGDLAAFVQNGQPLPGLARPAIAMGRHAALNVLRSLRGEPTIPFEYRHKGIIAVIGRYAAVGHIGPLQLTGLAGWLAWLTLHLAFLPGLRNRARVAAAWALSFLSGRRGARIMTHGPDDA